MTRPYLLLLMLLGLFFILVNFLVLEQALFVLRILLVIVAYSVRLDLEAYSIVRVDNEVLPRAWSVTPDAALKTRVVSTS